VRRAAHCSGGLKSHTARDHALVSKGGGNSSPDGEGKSRPMGYDLRKEKDGSAQGQLQRSRLTGCPPRGGIRRVCGESPGRSRGGYPKDESVGQR